MDATHATGEPTAPLHSGSVLTTRIDGAHSVAAEHFPAGGAGRTVERNAAESPASDESPEPAGLDILVAAAGLYSPDAEEQLQEQARQLAAHLQETQRTLDEREAHLHAQLARVENEVRVSRLWLRTREDQLREREEEIAERARIIAERETESARRGTLEESGLQGLRDILARRQEELEKSENESELLRRRLAEQAERMNLHEREAKTEKAAWERQRELEQQALEHRATQLTLNEERFNGTRAMWEERLAEQRAALHADRTRNEANATQVAAEKVALETQIAERDSAPLPSAPVAHYAASASEAHRLAAWEQALHDRAERLEAAEKLLAQHEEEHRLAVDLFRESERITLEERTADEALRERHAAQQRRELDARRESIDKQQQALTARQATLEQLHGDISRLHREALEMRLVSEELWAKLAGRAPPAELTRAVAETRSRLCDHFRISEAALVARQEELATLAEKLEFQQIKLADQRRDVQTWISAQQAELERQAARLAAREDQVAAQQKSLRQQEAAWHDERRQLQREIRQLLSRLRAAEPIAA